ncbi:hypothetical protein F4806DRAFT_468042 [Annulohypoxylon nitens]|nr:hypothetical protein F4806DRAFT_468042 [Annulohypoxylon nitens]
MEPPTKRMKLGQAPYDDDDEDEINLDELSMDPIQFDARQDPLYELDKGRAKAASRLKSAFERIFEKYERDFTDIGDEIDLETGEVIVNNGHLLSLQDEKDRNREGSISSDEEERIMRGKEASSVQASHTKPPVQNTSFTQPPMGYPAAPHQQLMTHPQFPSPGMPPNPYGFIDPFMGHGPADPLWQAPDLPMPLYQDRFGFIGQPMAYPPSFGYVYGPMMAPGGGFGHGSFGNHFRPQVPKKLPPARQLLPRASSDVDESEEDDVLLGGNTEEVIKSVSIKSVKALPPNTVAGKTKQAVPKNTKPVPVVEKEKDTQKPRRGRPKKTSVPAKSLDSNEGTNEKRGGNAEIIPTTEMINPTKSMNNSLPVPILPSPPPSEEPIPTEKATTELTKTDASTEVPIAASSDTPTEGDSQSSGSQRRRSSRGRKQTEFYGQINWTKSRKPNLDVTDTQTTTTEDLTQPSIPLVSEMNSSAEHLRPEDSLGKETMEPDLGTQREKINDKDVSNEVDVTVTSIPDQEHHEESLVNTDNLEEGEMPQSVPINPHPTVENSEQSGPLSSIGESDTAKIEIPPEDKGIPSPNESKKSDNLSDGERELSTYLLDRTAQDTTPQEPDIQEANVEVSGAEISSGAGEEIALPSVTEPDISVAVDENLESNSISDNPQETAQSPTIQIQLEEAAAQLPSPVQEEDLLPEAEIEIPESEIDEPESTELEMPVKSTPSQPSLTEDSDPISLPDEDEPELPPARLPIPHQSRIPGLFEKAELAFRPQVVVQKDPRAKILQRKSTSPSKSPSPSKHRPSLSAKPSTTPVPSTPKKKRRDSRTESGHTTASARKKYALTSLIPDDPDEDDDELSVLASSVAPSPFLSSYVHSNSKPHSRFNPLSAATPRKTGRRNGFLMGASSSTSRSALRTPHRISKRGAPPATDTRASRGPKLRYGSGSGSGVQSSPLARTVLSLNHRELLAATPSRRGRNKDRDEVGSVELGNSPMRTPGGTARRCGEDGFTCDRDFCFTCCK